MAPAQPYLTACMTYSNHASYMREWIEFHRLVGVKRFYLYDNGSRTFTRAVLFDSGKALPNGENYADFHNHDGTVV